MRFSLSTPAIVLRARPYGESDKIVSFLTERQGKLTGIAKGAKNSRRRFPNSLEPFAQITLHFEDRPHGRLAFLLSAELNLVYKELTQNLDKISYASYLVEITEGLIADREENQAVFEHLKKGLCYLDEYTPSLRFITTYELELMRLTGYQPVLDRCKACNLDMNACNGANWFFSPQDGGILCSSCSPGRHQLTPLSLSAAKMLIELQHAQDLSAAPVMLPASVVRGMRDAVSNFVQYHLDREIKSAPFLRVN
jgi:DNA repair protein RecO (recombination protein O)